MKFDFLIVYEVFPRELESAILLKCELEKRGHTVGLERRPFEDIMSLRKKYFNKVGAVLVPTVYSDEVMYSIYFIAGKVKKIINLQWEQVSSYSGEEETTGGRSMYPQSFCKEAVELCWGEKPRKNLIRAGMEEKKCIVTGPVHMDFLRKEFDGYYLDRNSLFNEFGLDTNRKVFLFISSFSLTAPPERLKKYLADIEGEQYIDEWTRFSLESQSEILNWFDKLLSEHPEIDLIYRPHPTEFDSVYLTEMKQKHSNFKVISDYSVKQWIITVDKVYVWFSTSSAEIFFSNTPFSILRPVEVSHEREITIFEGSKMISTYDGLVKNMNDFGEIPLNSEIMYNYYDFRETPSFLRICDALEEISNDSQYDVNWSGSVFESFKTRLNNELTKKKLMPFYTFALKSAEKVNSLAGTHFLKGRIDNYNEAMSNTLLVFHKDDSAWLKRIPELTEKISFFAENCRTADEKTKTKGAVNS